ncbi:NrfD/PsrC family molybdoenzyme membrane anchor subunit [Geotalea sp. SG265]|uniref:NrfD/PsrC family molybdoenzyme membrane anchor subunit n=1 Tax=Geotalea sp. SG265 TaxID=2922867 RepID=UPI001FAFBA57|nr:NrfD/PsrC family molybdoenzyme membrane anchor subunit [Geotalea sp. SG265]
MNLPWKRETVGRELNPQWTVLSGEGAGQKLRQPELRKGTWPVPIWHQVPSVTAEPHPDYYRLPLLKEPVWIWSVPAYFYLGGVAGGSAVLAAVLHGLKSTEDLAAACKMLAFLGTTVGPGLLTWDLGRKFRFINMLRVFRPTSPMSIGSWSLAATGLLASLSLLQGEKPSGQITGWGLAAGGLVLAGYTGVLLGNTANPLWHETRRGLPVLFVASSLASTAAVLEMLPLNNMEAGVVRQLGLMGKAAELAAIAAVEGEAARKPLVAQPLQKGRSSALWRGAKALIVAGMAVSLIPGRWRGKHLLGGGLTTVGSIMLRYALLEAGKESAREPQAVFAVQK